MRVARENGVNGELVQVRGDEHRGGALEDCQCGEGD